jgi:hypothetical protein
MPVVRPSTVHDRVVVVQDLPPGFDVTVYPLIAAPPVVVGAFHDTTETPFAPEVAVTPVGAPGAAAGTAGADAVEAVPVPDALVAVTVNVYATPLVRPSTTHEVVEVVQILPPGLEVTV